MVVLSLEVNATVIEFVYFVYIWVILTDSLLKLATSDSVGHQGLHNPKECYVLNK